MSEAGQSAEENFLFRRIQELKEKRPTDATLGPITEQECGLQETVVWNTFITILQTIKTQGISPENVQSLAVAVNDLYVVIQSKEQSSAFIQWLRNRLFPLAQLEYIFSLSESTRQVIIDGIRDDVEFILD